MIELNEVTKHDFLNRKLVEELLEVGVDMSDATYYIARFHQTDKEAVFLGKPADSINWEDVLPTYTIAQLHFKLHEHIYPTIDGIEYSGGLRYVKDAPFYIFYYDLKHGEKQEDGTFKEVRCPEHKGISAEGETPIESLAYLLKQCHIKHTGITYKNGTPCDDAGEITSKYSDYKWR